MLERHLIFCTIADQPVRFGVANAVTEDSIQAPGHLVDEIVNIALQAAIVVTGENHAPLLIDHYAASKVDGFDAREILLVEDVTHAVVDALEDAQHGEQPKPARLDVANGTELVLRHDVLNLCKLLHMRIIRLDIRCSITEL